MDKRGINLFIELEKLKLNQLDGRNIRTSVQLSRSKAKVSPKKNRTRINVTQFAKRGLKVTHENSVLTSLNESV